LITKRLLSPDKPLHPDTGSLNPPHHETSKRLIIGLKLYSVRREVLIPQSGAATSSINIMLRPY
ncbi:MAG: hypothetical protein QXQ31_08275, partial [Zestosphaera sp.]